MQLVPVTQRCQPPPREARPNAAYVVAPGGVGSYATGGPPCSGIPGGRTYHHNLMHEPARPTHTRQRVDALPCCTNGRVFPGRICPAKVGMSPRTLYGCHCLCNRKSRHPISMGKPWSYPGSFPVAVRLWRHLVIGGDWYTLLGVLSHAGSVNIK